MKYLWAFIIFIILIIAGIISIIGELLEFMLGVAMTGFGFLALLGLWIYIKVKK
jgi:Sec-independent protein secretion pathway component TatC